MAADNRVRVSVRMKVILMMMMMLMIPILVVLSAKVMTQGVVIHRLQQPLPSLLLQVTYIGQKLVVGKAFAPIVLPVGPVQEMHDSDEHP